VSECLKVETWLADNVVVVDGSGRREGGLRRGLHHSQPSKLDRFLEILKKRFESLQCEGCMADTK
jgi:hypothetical protein